MTETRDNMEEIRATVTIPLDVYTQLILDNQRLRESELYLKDRLDRNICDIRFALLEIKDRLMAKENLNDK